MSHIVYLIINIVQIVLTFDGNFLTIHQRIDNTLTSVVLLPPLPLPLPVGGSVCYEVWKPNCSPKSAFLWLDLSQGRLKSEDALLRKEEENAESDLLGKISQH